MDESILNDKRKARKTLWGECHLSLAYAKGSINPYYNATTGSVDEAGKQLAFVAHLAGRRKQTKIHCLGDGTPWISDQVEMHFKDFNLFQFFCTHSNISHRVPLS